MLFKLFKHPTINLNDLYMEYRTEKVSIGEEAAGYLLYYRQ